MNIGEIIVCLIMGGIFAGFAVFIFIAVLEEVNSTRKINRQSELLPEVGEWFNRVFKLDEPLKRGFFLAEKIIEWEDISWQKRQKLLEGKEANAKIKDEAQKERKERELWGDLWEEKQSIKPQIQQIADDKLNLFNGMPRVKAHLVNESILEEDGSQTAAYGGSGEIWIKYDYYKTTDRYGLTKTILHEMTHCWIHWKKIHKFMEDAHGKEFQDKLTKVCRMGL